MFVKWQSGREGGREAGGWLSEIAVSSSVFVKLVVYAYLSESGSNPQVPAVDPTVQNHHKNWSATQGTAEKNISGLAAASCKAICGSWERIIHGAEAQSLARI